MRAIQLGAALRDRRRRSQRLAVIALLILTVLLAGGCGSDSESSSELDEQPEPVGGDDEGTISPADEGTISSADEGTISSADEGTISSADEGTISPADEAAIAAARIPEASRATLRELVPQGYPVQPGDLSDTSGLDELVYELIKGWAGARNTKDPEVLYRTLQSSGLDHGTYEEFLQEYGTGVQELFDIADGQGGLGPYAPIGLMANFLELEEASDGSVIASGLALELKYWEDSSVRFDFVAAESLELFEVNFRPSDLPSSIVYSSSNELEFLVELDAEGNLTHWRIEDRSR